MAGDHAKFFKHKTYAVVGHNATRPFPKLTYEGLIKAGKKVFPVDPSVKKLGGHRVYPDLSGLPGIPDAVIIEVPPEEAADWVRRAAKAGIGRVWVHQGADTQQVHDVAEEYGLTLLTGRCAAMYLSKGFNIHTIHRTAAKLLGKY